MTYSIPYELFDQLVLSLIDQAIRCHGDADLLSSWETTIANRKRDGRLAALASCVAGIAERQSQSFFMVPTSDTAAPANTFEAPVPERSSPDAGLRLIADNETRYPLAADYLRFPAFRRNINVIDIVFDAIWVVVAENAAAIALITAANAFAGKNPLEIAGDGYFQAFLGALGERVAAYVKKIRSLPALAGIEHCVYIKAIVRYQMGERFSVRDLIPLYRPNRQDDARQDPVSPTPCNIPARKFWRCSRREAGSCLLLSEEVGELIADLDIALNSLADKGFIEGPTGDFFTIPLLEGPIRSKTRWCHGRA